MADDIKTAIQKIAELQPQVVTTAARAALSSDDGVAHPWFYSASLTDAERQHMVEALFNEMFKGLGIERFLQATPLALHQFALTTYIKNHDTKGLIVSLVNSFMATYQWGPTHQRAMAALIELENLRQERAAFIATQRAASGTQTSTKH